MCKWNTNSWKLQNSSNTTLILDIRSIQVEKAWWQSLEHSLPRKKMNLKQYEMLREESMLLLKILNKQDDDYSVGLSWNLRNSEYCQLLLFSHLIMSNFCNIKDYNTPVFPVLHHLLELAETHVHGVSGAVQPSHPLVIPFPSCLLSFPASWSAIDSTTTMLCLS